MGTRTPKDIRSLRSVLAAPNSNSSQIGITRVACVRAMWLRKSWVWSSSLAYVLLSPFHVHGFMRWLCSVRYHTHAIANTAAMLHRKSLHDLLLDME
eukprot:6478600-Amphidinium_carterae.1